ncbi:uncharacterized protein O3C94_002841 [Discoglossus pictus]
MEALSIVSLTIREPVLLLFFTWIQCSPDPPLKVVYSTLGHSETVSFHYDSYEYRDFIRVWCRQLTPRSCDIIVESRQRTSGTFNTERLIISEILERNGSASVTIPDLKGYDTGLYRWTVWNGNQYRVIENVLLMVVKGLPSSLEVVRAPLHGEVNMQCSYKSMQKWSKIWCKQKTTDECEWVAHSRGAITSDYQSRAGISVDNQARVMIMNLKQLELWDSGLYQCKENGGSTILKELLLLVTPENNDVATTEKSETGQLSTQQALKPTHPLHTHTDGIGYSYMVTTTNTRPVNPDPTTVTSRVILVYRVWDVLRWLLLLILVLYLLIFSFYKRILGLFHRNPRNINMEYEEPSRIHHKRKFSPPEILSRNGSASVTIPNLKSYDTGLYRWKVRDENQYRVIENVLLMVVKGLPSSVEVVRAPFHGEVNMQCSYNNMQKWTKFWCKQINTEACYWVVHSNGHVTSDYWSRAGISVDDQASVMIMNLKQLEPSDTGLYQCKENGGETVLKEILLLVTPGNKEGTTTTKSETWQTHSNQASKPHPFPTNPDGANSGYMDTTPYTQLVGPNRTTETYRVNLDKMQYRVWDVLRWLLLLTMVVYLLLFSFYKRIPGVFYILSLCKGLHKPERYQYGT